jgi:hypothetical protein
MESDRESIEEDVRTCPFKKASCNECGHFMSFDLAGDFGWTRPLAPTRGV